MRALLAKPFAFLILASFAAHAHAAINCSARQPWPVQGPIGKTRFPHTAVSLLSIRFTETGATSFCSGFMIDPWTMVTAESCVVNATRGIAPVRFVQGFPQKWYNGTLVIRPCQLFANEIITSAVSSSKAPGYAVVRFRNACRKCGFLRLSSTCPPSRTSDLTACGYPRIYDPPCSRSLQQHCQDLRANTGPACRLGSAVKLRVTRVTRAQRGGPVLGQDPTLALGILDQVDSVANTVSLRPLSERSASAVKDKWAVCVTLTGDGETTLEELAGTCGTTVTTLKLDNGLPAILPPTSVPPDGATLLVCPDNGRPDNGRFNAFCAPAPLYCVRRRVVRNDTLWSVAALYGTTPLQLRRDNPGLPASLSPLAALAVGSLLAVCPEGRVRGHPRFRTSVAVPRETQCVGNATQPCLLEDAAFRPDCLCSYSRDGFYQWPFGGCSQYVNCVGWKAVGGLLACPPGQEYDREKEMLRVSPPCSAPSVSTTDCPPAPCLSHYCYCQAYLLPRGVYQDPFEARGRSAFECDNTGQNVRLYQCNDFKFNPATQLCEPALEPFCGPPRRTYDGCLSFIPEDYIFSITACESGAFRRRLQGLSTLPYDAVPPGISNPRFCGSYHFFAERLTGCLARFNARRLVSSVSAARKGLFAVRKCKCEYNWVCMFRMLGGCKV